MAIGYWLSRQVFERYDLAKRKSDQKRFKRRLEIYLETGGWNKAEVKEAIETIYKEDEQ
jgi:hypothetical protein